MSQPAADNRYRTVGVHAERAVLLFATLCILMMPSIYRGGSSVPHSHGFFQFVISGPERAFDHHRGMEDHAHHGHAGHLMAEAGTEHAAPDSDAARDEPQVSPSSAPGGTITAVVFTLSVLLALVFTSSTRWAFPQWRPNLAGRLLAPEPPPPRGLCPA